MTTSDSPSPSSPTAAREALRLNLAEDPTPGNLGGAWWPQSRDLPTELAELIDEFPEARGRVMRGLFSPPDWDKPPRKIPTRRGFVKVGSFPHDDTHVVTLTVSASPRRLLLLVVPPDTPADTAATLMAGAASVEATSAKALLTEHGVL